MESNRFVNIMMLSGLCLSPGSFDPFSRFTPYKSKRAAFANAAVTASSSTVRHRGGAGETSTRATPSLAGGLGREDVDDVFAQ